MNRIVIGDTERALEAATESWIIHQIRERQSDNQSVCVKVILKGDGVDMILATPECGSGGAGGRGPNSKEQELFDKWDSRHMNKSDWAVGNLVAFLKQAKLLG